MKYNSTWAMLAACLLKQAYSFRTMCLTSPLITLEAGKTNVSAFIEAPRRTRCEATMQFSDPAFLPIHYNFTTIQCGGQQLATFTVPAEVPNGDADIIWRCAGLTPYCARASVSGGQADPALELEREGDVGCVLEHIQTTTALVTRTRSTGIIVETLPSMFTVTTTSFPQEHRTPPVTLSDSTASTSSPTEPAESTTSPSTSTSTASATNSATAHSPKDSALKDSPTGLTNRDRTASTPVTAPTLKPTGDGVFVSSASRLATPLTSTLTLFTTITVFQTLSAGCTTV